MNTHYRFLLLFGCFHLFLLPKANACGYAWISDCASQVQLRINGTLDSFNIAACPAGFNFDGIQLGSLQSLSLANAKAITWESCQNNVSPVYLKYRVYEQGFNGGNWQSLTLQEYHQTIEGPYTTRYNSAPTNISLTNGLTVGKTYILELYLQAAVDTIGDDFIPETTIVKNNNGANYKMTFVYGGPAAAPILLLPHLKEPNCNGGNDGNIYVSAYGNIAGLFYAWSNISLNFFQQYNLTAGNYGITVTNATGQSASATMPLGQPGILQAIFTNVQSVGCNNSPGAATVMASGGTAPYTYLWQTGQQSNTVQFTSGGNWHVTVTDAHNCTTVGTVAIGNNGLVERDLSANICEGAVYHLGGQSFSAAGNYTLTIPGTSGCDTLTHLTLYVITPADALTSLPDSILVTCAAPQVALCALTIPGAAFQWIKDGIPATGTPCLLATAGGNYTVQVSLGGCMASKTIVSTEHLIVSPAQVTGTILFNCHGAPPSWLVAHTVAVSPTYSWVYQGNVISNKDSCFFQVTEFQGGNPVFPSLTITDQFGCQNSLPTFNILVGQGPTLELNPGSINHASSTTAADGSITINPWSGAPPYSFLWSNGATTKDITGLLFGTYCITVTDSDNCTASACYVVSAAMATNSPERNALTIFPNPVAAGSRITLDLPPTIQGDNFAFDMTDMEGMLLSREIFMPQNAASFSIKIPAELNQSMILLRLTSNNYNYIGRLIIQNH